MHYYEYTLAIWISHVDVYRDNNVMKVFTLERDQINNITEWVNTHECSFRGRSTGAIGGLYTYEFTPTSLGVISRVKCACGSACDVTDYADW